MDNFLVLKYGFKLVSGGQTGVDLVGLRFGHMFGFPTGGLAPRGFKTQNGSKPELGSVFKLTEANGGYSIRTYGNVANSDFTLIMAQNLESAGTKLTRLCAQELHKPHLAIELPKRQGNNFNIVFNDIDQAALMINERLVTFTGEQFTLNIAGNSAKTAPDVFIPAFYYLMEIMQRVHSNIQSNDVDFKQANSHFNEQVQRLKGNLQLLQALNNNFSYIPDLDARGMRGLVL
jgi:hypothetical protein